MLGLLVSGEPVAGKTALLTEFAQCAQQRDDDLVVLGDCNAQTGGGDLYLPFREVLGQLTGDVEDKLAQGGITAENADRLPGIMSVSVREASGLRQMKPAQTPYASR